LLPEMGTKEQSDAIMSVFRWVAVWMIVYAVATAVSFFFFRKSVKMILTLLNWFYIPSVGIWAFMAVQDILTK